MRKQYKVISKIFIRNILIVYTLVFLLITALFVYSDYRTKSLMAKQITRIVEGMLKKGDNREAIYTLSAAKLENFTAVGYFNRDNKRIFTLPARLNPSFFAKRSLWDRLINSSIKENIYFDSEEQNIVGSIRFVFYVFSSIPFAILIWLFGIVFTVPFAISYGKMLSENIDNEILVKESEAAAEIAEQVKHDIYAPIQSIIGVAQSSDGIDQFEKECLLNAVDRVDEIVQDLASDRPKKNLKTISPLNLASTINSIIAEKSMSSNIRIEPVFTEATQGALASVSESEFKRVLSNLIDNAVNAIEDSDITSSLSSNNGKIRVTLDIEGKFLKLAIVDNGIGIPRDILNKIGKRGLSFRAGGSGLGLNYAISKIKEWNGKIIVKSENGKGTNVLIDLPLYT